MIHYFILVILMLLLILFLDGSFLVDQNNSAFNGNYYCFLKDKLWKRFIRFLL